MSSKSPISFLQTILFILAGVFTIIAITFVWNELVARFENPSMVMVIFVFFFSLWAAGGAMMVPRGVSRESRELMLSCALMLLPATALISVISAMFFPIPQRWIGDMTGIVAGVGFATLWIGIVSGMVTGLLFTLNQTERLSREFAGGLGLIAGSMIFLAPSLRWQPPPAYLAITGIAIIFMAVIGRDRTIDSNYYRQRLWIIATVAMLISAGGVYATQEMNRSYWKNVMPGWNFQGQINTSNGRVNVLKRKPAKQNSLTEITVFRNNIAVGQYPEDSEKYIAAMLPLALQSDTTNLKVLLFDSPFSFVSQALQNLPFIEEIVQISPSATLNDYAVAAGYWDEPRYYCLKAIDPIEFLRKSQHKYDIIIILEPIITGELITERFCSLLMERLNSNGVLAVPSVQLNNFSPLSAQTLAKHFKHKVVMPGCRQLQIWGNGNVTGNIEELEKRLVRLSAPVMQIPMGILSTIYSITDEPPTVEGILWDNDVFAGVNSQEVAMPQLSLVLSLLVCILLYVIIRFFLTRIGNYGVGFGSFENGFFAVGVLLLLMIAAHHAYGTIGQIVPLLLGMLGWMVFGKTLFAVPYSKMITAALSCLCPLLFFFNNNDYFQYLLPVAVIVLAVSVGLVEELLTRRITSMPGERLPVLRCVGCACGTIFFTLIILSGGGIIVCIILLLLFRLPLLFSVMPFDSRRS